MTSYLNLVRNKNRKIEEALKAIDDAKQILTKLEGMAGQALDGEEVDVAEVAVQTHALRGATDRILVGMIESTLRPSNGREA